MTSSFFFLQADKTHINQDFIEGVERAFSLPLVSRPMSYPDHWVIVDIATLTRVP